ncbi:MAG: hypothetical protein JST55_12860 [Bacteroidetes bacterium]|nr:hypothetical protein [Bacteroidota bacterium]
MKNRNTISIYHFINYNRNDLSDYIKRLGKLRPVVCFDLEDSVQDLLHPKRNSALKIIARKKLLEIFNSCNFPDTKIGIRLNSFHSSEFILDIKLLSELNKIVHINSLLIPKSESNSDVEKLTSILSDLKIEVDEVIPIIETQKGFENLQSMLENKSEKVKQIAFGHCDFNIDKNIFPFHHQNSREYWNWVKEFLSILESHNIEFVNSPYLKLNDSYSFNSMLSKLNHFCNGSFGQISLTYKQTELCSEYDSSYKDLNGFDKKLTGVEISEYAKRIIDDFESNNKSKGFSVTSANKTLISPHEYISAKKYLREA